MPGTKPPQPEEASADRIVHPIMNTRQGMTGTQQHADHAAALAQFDDFLFIMDEQLEALEGEAAALGIALTRDMAGLPQLEQLALRLLAQHGRDAIGALSVYLGRYLGEIACTCHGGRWVLPLDDLRDIHYKQPVIDGICPVPQVYLAPINLVRAFLLRQRADLFRSAIAALVHPKPLDLSHLAEE